MYVKHMDSVHPFMLLAMPQLFANANSCKTCLNCILVDRKIAKYILRNSTFYAFYGSLKNCSCNCSMDVVYFVMSKGSNDLSVIGLLKLLRV